jgi:hypothetical protein
MTQHQTPPELVRERFGSNKATARAINKHCRHTMMRPIADTTPGRWIRRGYIPGEWAPMILHAARCEGIDIQPEHLIYGNTKI